MKIKMAEPMYIYRVIADGKVCELLNYGWRACAKANPIRFRAEPWDCGEYVITADGSPVGRSIAKMHAEAACEWVATAWAELIKANVNHQQKAGEP